MPNFQILAAYRYLRHRLQQDPEKTKHLTREDIITQQRERDELRLSREKQKAEVILYRNKIF